MTVILPSRTDDAAVSLPLAQGRWLLDLIDRTTPRLSRNRTGYPRIAELREQFEEQTQGHFDEFWNGKAWRAVRKMGLLLV
jgi:hypothetical protein